jgi:hypothetical protein
MASCTRLEEIANQKRQELLQLNTYSENDFYSSTHPNATQEIGDNDPKNRRGKGTGISFDTSGGGSSVDINGDPNISNTGRQAIFNINTYTPDNIYDCFI